MIPPPLGNPTLLRSAGPAMWRGARVAGRFQEVGG
jgi:hypothetical protein